MARRLIAFSILVCALGVPSASFADPKQDALKHFEAGRLKREKGDCQGAIVEFTEVLRAGESVGAYLNIAQCYDQMKKYRKAVQAFDKALLVATEAGDDRKGDANKGAIDVRAQHPWITLAVNPNVETLEGLSISVDGEPVPHDEYNGEIFRDRPGKHVVTVAAKDYETTTFNANDRERVELRADMLRLRPERIPPPPGGGGGGGWGWQKWTGLGLFGGGLIAGTIAGVNGGSYLAVKDRLQPDVTGNCATDGHLAKVETCKLNGVVNKPLQDKATDYNTNEKTYYSRIILPLAISVAMLGTGVFLFVTAPKSGENAATVRFAPTLGGGTVVGTF